MAELKDGFWSLPPIERTRIVAEKLLMRMLKYKVSDYVNDAHLANWVLNATDDGKLQMKRNDDALLISWDELRVCRGQNNISVPSTKDNFVSEMERFNDFFIGNER